MQRLRSNGATCCPQIFGENLRRTAFTNLFLLFSIFVAIGSFTADGGLLQPTGGVKTTPQKTRFRSVNLYKEFAYRSKLSKWLRRQELEIDDTKHRAKPNNVKCGEHVSVVDANA